MSDATELQRFPIGRFERRDQYTATERADHIARLASQPRRLAAAVSGFNEHDHVTPYRPGGWTVLQLVHHVADSHLNAYTRVKLGLTEAQPTIKPYDQDAWVRLADSALSPLISLALFEATHARLDAVLRSMRAEEFTRTILHPENGVMTLDQVVAMYAWHGDHHVAHLEAYRSIRIGATPAP
jgi:hypothetical protein